ncbi:hypothetical protein LAWASA_4156 [Lawsonibacter asaccharolyticus]|nr:hypothetical protein LAWASA_4156 [Lawsonibacter asaccharolyticus]
MATEFSVDILPQTLLGIMITQMPEKTDYAPGESFDAKGMIVSGFYDSGMIEPIRSYAISPDRPLQEGDVAILISSVDKTAVVPIKVGEMFRPKPAEPQPWRQSARPLTRLFLRQNRSQQIRPRGSLRRRLGSMTCSALPTACLAVPGIKSCIHAWFWVHAA